MTHPAIKAALEEWKPAPDYEGIYEVSNLGRVRSVDRYCGRDKKYFRKGCVLKPAVTYNGYLKVELCREGKKKSVNIHRLVGKAFIKNNGLREIDHIDGNKQNNAVSNLRWCTRRKNIHYYFNGEYTGTHLCKKTGNWVAIISVGGKDFRLGSFKSRKEAYAAYMGGRIVADGFDEATAALVAAQMKGE